MGRFISPDTFVPDPMNPQAFNRYSYCLNNPLKYTDTSGHIVYINGVNYNNMGYLSYMSLAQLCGSPEYQIYYCWRNRDIMNYSIASFMEKDTSHTLEINSTSSDTQIETIRKGNTYEMVWSQHELSLTQSRNSHIEMLDWQIRNEVIETKAGYNWLRTAFVTGMDVTGAELAFNIPEDISQMAHGKKSIWQGLKEIGADIANEAIGIYFWPYRVGSSLCTAYSDFVDQQQSAYREYMEN